MLSQEEVLKRFKNLNGDLYDYSKVEYKGKDVKVCIGCKIHGEFWQSPHNHYKGQGCPVCGGIKQATNATRTTQEFVKLAQEKHNNLYDYSKVDYVKSNKNVVITCRKHGDFSMKPVNHLVGQGCSKCFRERQAADQAYDTELYIQKAREKHNDRFDYSLVNYTRSTDKIDIICKKHGIFTQEAACHLTGVGCPKCAAEHTASLKVKDTAHFIERARSVHGDRYDYSKVAYERCKYRVEIICKEHGSFRQQASNHLSGLGCAKCAKTGFDPSKAGILYVLECGELTKIGITNKTAKQRAKAISKSFGDQFKVVKEFSLDGQYCTDLETAMLQYLRKNYKNPDRRFDGFSESFVGLSSADLVEMLECLV
jgi:hypothetical protein